MKKLSLLMILSGHFLNNLKSATVTLNPITPINPVHVRYSKKQIIDTTYPDPSQEVYKGMFVPSEGDSKILVVDIQDQNNLDAVKALTHQQILAHSNELSLIEEQIRENALEIQKNTQQSKQFKLKDFEKKELKKKEKQLQKQQNLTLKLLKRAKQQEAKLADRQQELYKLNKLSKTYKKETVLNSQKVSLKFKTNQKLDSIDVNNIFNELQHYYKLSVFVQPSDQVLSQNYTNVQGTMLDADSIKPKNTYYHYPEYITDQSMLNYAIQEATNSIAHIENQLRSVNTVLKDNINSATGVSLNTTKKDLTYNLNFYKQRLTGLKKREAELRKLSNFHFKYNISYNLNIPSRIRSDEGLNPHTLSVLSKIFYKYNNLTLVMTVKSEELTQK